MITTIHEQENVSHRRRVIRWYGQYFVLLTECWC